jgi:hypothetical protein
MMGAYSLRTDNWPADPREKGHPKNAEPIPGEEFREEEPINWYENAYDDEGDPEEVRNPGFQLTIVRGKGEEG